MVATPVLFFYTTPTIMDQEPGRWETHRLKADLHSYRFREAELIDALNRKRYYNKNEVLRQLDYVTRQIEQTCKKLGLVLVPTSKRPLKND